MKRVRAGVAAALAGARSRAGGVTARAPRATAARAAARASSSFSLSPTAATGARRRAVAPFDLGDTNASLVGGAWVPAASRATTAVVNPADGAELCRVPDMGAADTAAAIAAARAAAPGWAATPAPERGRALQRLAGLLLGAADGVAALLAAECGKPLDEARGEVAYAADYLSFYGEEARRPGGEVLAAPAADRRQLTLSRPAGVAALLTPWNFSAAMPARKLAPALAAGCTVVLRPSSLTPLCALALGRLADAAGVPPGVVNIVVGEDHAGTAGALCASPAVAKVSFTGSTRVGRLLAAAAAPGLKRLSLELGGRAPFIVLPDADVAAAAEGAAASKFRNAGQTCVCANTFYVHDSVRPAFVAALAARAAALAVGDAFLPGVAMGPLISAAAVDRVHGAVLDAVRRGARVVTGGARVPAAATGGRGHFYAPTVLDDVPEDAAAVREEIFGPVAPVVGFSDAAGLLARLRADADRPGLAAYYYTASASAAWRVADALDYVGIVGVNTGLVSAANAPFGGQGSAGYGREGARAGLAEYTATQYVMMAV